MEALLSDVTPAILLYPLLSSSDLSGLDLKLLGSRGALGRLLFGEGEELLFHVGELRRERLDLGRTAVATLTGGRGLRRGRVIRALGRHMRPRQEGR